MTRWLVRFGYDGSRFLGWARQPGARTIEGCIRDGLTRRNIAPSADGAHLEVASRTDRGVSARANALALVSEVPPDSLLRRLNAISPEIFFTAIAPLAPGFRVRHADRRVYRYFDPRPPIDPVGGTRAAELFRGRIDVRSFGRGLAGSAPVWRTVEAVTVRSWQDGRTIEVRAPSFVWGMVRKIVGALREVDLGRLSIGRLEEAIKGHARLTLPLSEPDGLVLWEVQYGSVPWVATWPGPNRHQAAYVVSTREALAGRQAVVRAIFDRQLRPSDARATGGPSSGF